MSLDSDRIEFKRHKLVQKLRELELVESILEDLQQEIFYLRKELEPKKWEVVKKPTGHDHE